MSPSQFLLTGLLAVSCFTASAESLQPPEIAASAYFLMDITANQVLAAKNEDAPVEPASLTKLMSAYLVFDALKTKKVDLKQALPVSERAWKMPGSRMFIDPKMRVPVEDLIKGMIVQSGNDATIALAEGVGGNVERFVQMMNDQAKALGMKGTSYKNPEGLTATGHVTTARDLSILARRLMSDFPEYIGFYSIKKYRYPGTPSTNDSNRNLLLFRDPSVDGLKTGYTEAAGYCMVATANRQFPNLAASAPAVTGSSGVVGNAAVGGGRRLLSIVLGTVNENARANESQKLLNWGYTAYQAVKLFDANQAVSTANVWKGKASAVNLGQTPQPIVVAVPAGTVSKLKTEVIRSEPLVAPIAKGQQVGILKTRIGNEVIAETPLVALEAVEQTGILGRAWDAIRLWLR
jgi:D-alanyl-D-alanine carboxypeptidase (penicillin-binding protein 5/6)